MNIRASLTIGLPAFLVLLGGCIIVDGPIDGTTSGSGGNGNDRITTSSSSSSSSSSSGMGGAGGVGGEGGAGGGGGSTPCVDDDDGILDAQACNALNTQATGNVCGPNMDLAPAANGTCTRLAEIIQGGAFDVLAKCLQNIPGDPVNACDDSQVADCVKAMYASACPSADGASLCQQFAQQNCTQPFDTQQCLIDLNPLNAAGLNEMITCVNMHLNLDCNEAYDMCYPGILSY